MIDDDDAPWEGVKPFKDNYPYKEDHIYIVDVSWRSSNPVHRAILHVGFLNKDSSLEDTAKSGVTATKRKKAPETLTT